MSFCNPRKKNSPSPHPRILFSDSFQQVFSTLSLPSTSTPPSTWDINPATPKRRLRHSLDGVRISGSLDGRRVDVRREEKGKGEREKRRIAGKNPSIVTRRRQALSTAVKATRNEKGAATKRLTTKGQLRGDSIPVAKSIHGVVDDSGIRNGRVSNLSRHAAVSNLYSIKASPGKGLGMFAAADIRKGTRILEEKPFFSLVERPELSESEVYAPDEISEAFGRLSVGDQDKYMSLHCPERPNCSVLFSIYEANCYEMGSGACICLDASRINHSCIPNAHFSWNTNIERETLHAVKDIFKGEEITISYCPAIRAFDERKSILESYSFTCRCPACRKDQRFGIMSQTRRLQMLDLDHEIADFHIDAVAAQEEYDERNEEPAILRLVDLMDKEGLVYDKSRAYRDAAECALEQGLREEALEYAGKELDVECCCVGRDAPSYLEAISFFLKIYFGPEEIVD